MLRMGSADKKTRKKRTRKISKPLSSPSSGSVQTAQSSLPPFLPELAPQKPEVIILPKMNVFSFVFTMRGNL